MKSPFPGMDPYLEAYWLDVHTRIITYAADALNSLLPRGILARTQERIGIETDDGDSGVLLPDVNVIHAVGRKMSGQLGVAEALGRFKLLALHEQPIERYIEITTADGSQLITVIEFISPSNKGRGRIDFVDKRQTLLAGGVNFVEIDLTRGGEWRKLLLPQKCPPEAVAAYRYTIRIPQESGVAYLQPISLREPLPVAPIPLREDEPRVSLELQPLIEQVYEKGRYEEAIRYERPPTPPLNEPDAAWAQSLLLAAGKRSA